MEAVNIKHEIWKDSPLLVESVSFEGYGPVNGVFKIKLVWWTWLLGLGIAHAISKARAKAIIARYAEPGAVYLVSVL